MTEPIKPALTETGGVVLWCGGVRQPLWKFWRFKERSLCGNCEGCLHMARVALEDANFAVEAKWLKVRKCQSATKSSSLL